MAACCGVPPYTPDQLMEIVVTDSTVSDLGGHRAGPAPPAQPARRVRPGRFGPGPVGGSRQRRGGRAVPGPGQARPRPRRGGDRRRARALLPSCRWCVRPLAEGKRLAISYYSASTDRVTDREIAPRRVFAAEGHWYVDASVEPPATSGGSGSTGSVPPRSSRAATKCGGGSTPAVSATADGDGGGNDGRPAFDFHPFVPGPDSRRVRLSIDPATAWLVESVPSAGPPSRSRRPGRARDLRRRRRLAGASPPPARARRPGGRTGGVPGAGRRRRPPDPAPLSIVSDGETPRDNRGLIQRR